MARLTIAVALWMAMTTRMVSAAPVESDACRGTCDKFPDRYCEPWNAICELCPSECRDSRVCSIPKCARYYQKSSTPPTTLPTTTLPVQPHRDPITSSSRVVEGGTTATLLKGVSKPVRATEERETVPDNKEAGTPNKGGSFTVGTDVGSIIAACASGVVLALGVVVYRHKNQRHSSVAGRRPQGVANDEGRPPFIGEESGPIGGAALVGEDQVFLANDTQPPIQESRV